MRDVSSGLILDVNFGFMDEVSFGFRLAGMLPVAARVSVERLPTGAAILIAKVVNHRSSAAFWSELRVAIPVFA
jgi:hypothetical protein